MSEQKQQKDLPKHPVKTVAGQMIEEKMKKRNMLHRRMFWM